MIRPSYIILNGKFIDSSTAVFTTKNRAFRYGDGLFESVFVSGGRAPLLSDHFNRLKKNAGILNLIWPQLLTISILEKEIIRLVNKNRIFGGARLRLSLFREDGGFYKPATNKSNYLIEVQSLSNTRFILNSKGLIIGLYDVFNKHDDLLSNMKTSSALISVMAGIYAQKKGLDDCLLLNNNGNIIEASGSNLFLRKGKELITPSLESGCVDGVMRKNLIRVAVESGIDVKDEEYVNQEDLINAEEVFLTNAVSGIMWVMAFKEKRYYNKTSYKLVEKLNDRFFPNS